MLVLKAMGWMKRCDNGLKYGVCNWVVNPSQGHALCGSCRMNRTIPDLDGARNVALWGRMEAAKRRLIYTLLSLGLTLPSRKEDPKTGLAFDIVSTTVNPTVTTGHLNGVITVNLEEADDIYRQINQQQLGESRRTLLGHFRHESAHYVWQRFLSELTWEHPHRLAFRERFGDEWLDYAKALSEHYERGVITGWEKDFVSAYASSHPWEDWAETWAHYLEMVDGLETSEGLGIEISRIALPAERFAADAASLPAYLEQSAEADAAFLSKLQQWISLSTVLNELSTSFGEPSPYPFSISNNVAKKLRLVHYLAGVWGKGR